MDPIIDNSETAYIDDKSDEGKKIKPIPKAEPDIGIDMNDLLIASIEDGYASNKVNISSLNSFTQISQNRDQLYALLDTMAEDSTVAAILKTFAQDATEYNLENGRIVWSESDNSDINKYITYLLDTMNIDKHVYKWVISLCKYGDLYLKLFRNSDVEEKLFNNKETKKLNEARSPVIPEADYTPEKIDEELKIKVYPKNDNYTHYIEMVSNPAEMFELVKYGKTQGYIQACIPVLRSSVSQIETSYYRYQFNKNDVYIHNATDFVHACLDDNTSRQPEEVKIFLDDENSDNNSTSYTVKRGQSILYNSFKIWRQRMLILNSILLNRLTKSSIIRVCNVEVGDMPKANVKQHLLKIKQLIEQKAAISEGKSITEYTNPGPVENTIYVPTHNGQGALSINELGGEVNVKDLADLDALTNQFFGSFGIPKQYFGETDDAAGFNGGTSLSIISSRYAKAVKNIQNAVIQALTDAINLMLIDKGLNNYVNKFTLKMLPPTTQEELDRGDAINSRIRNVNDIMTMLGDVEDTSAKLKILKFLLSSVVNDSEIINILEDEIKKLEKEQEVEEVEGETPDEEMEDIDNISSMRDRLERESRETFDTPERSEPEEEIFSEVETDIEEPENDNLPTPDSLGIDMTDNTQEI